MQVMKLVFLALMLLSQLATGSPPIVRPNCTDHCGDIKIPYPFGMGSKDCYKDKWFKVDCKNNRTVLTSLSMEVLNISLFSLSDSHDGVRVKGPILKSGSNCSGIDGGNTSHPSIDLTGSPFFLSPYNKFVAVGHTGALMADNTTAEVVGCYSRRRGKEDDFDWRQVFFNLRNLSTSEYQYTCNGTDCCQASVSSVLRVFKPSFQPTGDDRQSGCNLAFLANEDWVYGPEIYKQERLQYVPLELNWEMDPKIFDNITNDCSFIANSSVAFCTCNNGYEGNPYLGCTDIDECKSLERYGKCKGITKCVNTLGSYKCVGNSLLITTITLGGAIGVLAVIFGVWLAYKIIRKIRKTELRKKFFKRNGGLLLQQQVNSINGSLQKTKIFKSKELEKATDHFNKNRILGQGGQGTVYKGMLIDGRIVAVKKSTLVDEEKVQEFINEVVILSQINHRNVVKLLGCCLETEVPLLVYEFIPNGSLFQYLHERNEDVPLSWEMRLQIATEAAGAIAYLHSAAHIPIYHRDIKSTNILLDDKFRAKVSDFGTSRSIAIDQTHLTTHVQGTFGYLDPEYFQSGQFTEKSDVYSFGVVLTELLSGQKPIFRGRSEESTSLATYFYLLMEEKKLADIIDTAIMQHNLEEQITQVANLAKRCLNISGRFRPTMKEVATELEQIRSSSAKKISSQQNVLLSANPTLIMCDFRNCKSQSFEVEPLISYYETC